MVKGVGVDIVEIDRFQQALLRRKSFADRLFTPLEQKYCRSKRQPALHFAVRFAAKEAVSKAMGTGKRGLKWRDIEIRRDEAGKPYVLLQGSAADIAAAKDITEVTVSLSFSHKSAVASAIAT